MKARVGVASMATVIAVIVTAALTVGCARTIPGTAAPVKKLDTRLVDFVLPTVEEATPITGNPLAPPDKKPYDGGPEILFDGYHDDKDVSPFECVGIVATFQRATYLKYPILAVARQFLYSGRRGQNVFLVDASVFQLASTGAARTLFADFVRQWQSCSGKTVVTTRKDRTTIDSQIKVSDVAVSGPLLSAVSERSDTFWPTDKPKPMPMPEGRAIGVATDVVVDVSVAMDRDYGPPLPVGSRAVDIAELMMRKVAVRA